MQALGALQLNTTEEKLDWIFCIFDSDSGGTIEISEIEQLVSNIFEFADIKPNRRMMHACAMDVKRSVDRDNDGTITREEFINNARQGLSMLTVCILYFSFEGAVSLSETCF